LDAPHTAQKVLQKNPRTVLQPDREVCKMPLERRRCEPRVDVLLLKNELFVDDVSND
jgi:hypothetical protein